MPSFTTPTPVSATIQLPCGAIRIEASERDDTVVEVTPSNSARDRDIAAAAQTRVDFADGTLRVIAPKGQGGGILRKSGSVDVVVALPAGSIVDARTGLGQVLLVGSIGDARVRTGAGDVQVQDATSVDLVTGLGAISAGHVIGNATCTTGSGSVRLSYVDGSAQIKNSNGDTWLGGVSGVLKAKSSNGSIRVDRAGADVKASTANGDVHVGSTERGTVDLRTALGSIEVGIADGVAARLDLHTSFGAVRSELDATDRPSPTDGTVTVSAQTSAGDITIRRAPAPAAA